ncbi:hypothetical protein CEQ36_01505 [Yersinia intermedia]|nr:hypothetical protein A6J67_11890 [Yersinia sp. FDAARGOS_228]AVL34429.1 hypothetical protein CEQ36_01505 [Yersinia intermedia]OVZ76647.1 hypothetical protein CBW55_07625 [Yersinia intermedia]OWF92608.1 hypothetical protein B4916_03160 [Yersinia intermedia]
MSIQRVFLLANINQIFWFQAECNKLWSCETARKKIIQCFICRISSGSCLGFFYNCDTLKTYLSLGLTGW